MINKKLINISSANSENCWRNRLLLALSRLNAAIATVFLTSAISACATQPEPGAVIAPVPEVAATPVVTPTVVVTATPLVTPTVVVTATPQAGLPNGKLIGETVTVNRKHLVD